MWPPNSEMKKRLLTATGNGMREDQRVRLARAMAMNNETAERLSDAEEKIWGREADEADYSDTWTDKNPTYFERDEADNDPRYFEPNDNDRLPEEMFRPTGRKQGVLPPFPGTSQRPQAPGTPRAPRQPPAAMMADMGGGPVAGDLLGGRPGLGLSGLAPTPPAEEVYDPKNGDPERQKEFAAWKKAGGAQFVPPRAPGAIAETDLEERALERALERASMLRFGNTLEQSSRLAAGMPMGGDELRGRRESESAPMGEFAARMGVRMDRSKMMASLQEKLRQNGREDLADKLKQAEFGLKQKESAWKMGRPDLDERRLAETERHNREAEAIARSRATGSPGQRAMRGEQLDARALGKELDAARQLEADVMGLEEYTKQKDIPGVGPWDQFKGTKGALGMAVEGVGELIGGGVATSPEDINVQQKINSAVNKLALMVTGQAASQKQYDYIEATYGLHRQSERQIRGGINKFIEDVKRLVAGLPTKYAPDVVAQLRARGEPLLQDKTLAEHGEPEEPYWDEASENWIEP